MKGRRSSNSGFNSGGSSSIIRSAMNLCASKPHASDEEGIDKTISSTKKRDMPLYLTYWSFCAAHPYGPALA